MCGIIGIIGKEDVAEQILEGLRRLEYRGYDSAGIATVSDNQITRVRAEGKIRNLDKKLRESSLKGTVGIGHTRWATHGVPNTTNAHPHATDRVAVVHNGIIENFAELRAEMEAKNYSFATQTDTEVIPILITDFLKAGATPEEAVKKTLKRLHGAFALGIIFNDDNLLIAARHGSPLVIGYGEGEMYLGSDAIALAPWTPMLTYLEEGDMAILTREGATIFDAHGTQAQRPVIQSSISSITVGKENFPHFMLKEIYEQPSALGETLNAYYSPVNQSIQLPGLSNEKLKNISKVTIIACGTSYYAGMVAKYWLEQIAKIPVEVDIASEFRYREALLPENGMALFISQSGETADTLAALRYAKAQKQLVVALVNMPESTMAREADAVLRIYAGPEIGVASTKAFTTQLMTLACLALSFAQARGKLDAAKAKSFFHMLSEIPAYVAEALQLDAHIKQIATMLSGFKDVLYIGRGVSYPIALEGALKLKEISYIHAEATAAGELKHGPIALVDEKMPIVALAPFDSLFDKTASNIQEIAARNGYVVLISDAKGCEQLKSIVKHSITLPASQEMVTPILYSIPIQLLAYHVAVMKGTDIDQPRNLAKSVTVE